MNKLFFLLLIPILFACSSDNDSEPAIDYIDNNLIVGKWLDVDIEDHRTFYLVFEDNLMWEEIWKKIMETILDKYLMEITNFPKFTSIIKHLKSPTH